MSGWGPGPIYGFGHRAVAGPPALYGGGHLAHDSSPGTLGLHAGEAIVLGGAATAAVKLLAGRRRPFVDAGDADDAAPPRGIHGARASFPSGHTTVAFALAPAHPHDWMDRHLGALALAPAAGGRGFTTGVQRATR